MSARPFHSLLKTIGYIIKGRLHFPRHRIGESVTMEDGDNFTIFRHVVVSPSSNQGEPPHAVFRVRFRIENMSPQQNKRFSLIPIPFFIGLPGFRSKLWMTNETTGFNQGVYEWNTIQDAHNYANSFAMKFMEKRSVPGSISYQITKITEH